MKKMRKLVSLLCAVVMVLAMAVPAGAEEEIGSEVNNSIFNSLAEQYISISHLGHETIYANLQDFYAAVKELSPSVSDLDLAKFVMEYTGQSHEGLPDEILLETLDFVSITSSSQILRVIDENTVEELTLEDFQQMLSDSDIAPAAVWESSDGYMKITTTSFEGVKTPYGTPFTLACSAVWLKFPIFRLKDTFAVVYNGTFDDSYPIISTFTQRSECTMCSETCERVETEIYGPDSSTGTNRTYRDSELLELDYSQANAIGVICDLKLDVCSHIRDGALVNAFQTKTLNTTLRFRIYVSSTSEVRAAYAHAKLAGKITISGSVDPISGSVSPDFKGILEIIAEKYSAAPITLRCN